MRPATPVLPDESRGDRLKAAPAESLLYNSQFRHCKQKKRLNFRVLRAISNHSVSTIVSEALTLADLSARGEGMYLLSMISCSLVD